VTPRGRNTVEQLELVARRFGAATAFGAAALALPGIVRSTGPAGRAIGHPERVFSPIRLASIVVGWFGLGALLWRPLPWRPAPAVRAMLAPAGLILLVTGFAAAIAGRIALGSSYRPSSTLGFRLAPGTRLVTDGPYALVRHPIYAGLALASVGGLLLYRTWTAFWLVAQLPVLVVRAGREDAALAAEFGTAWSAYRDRVPGWLARRGRGTS
jgi:protein-S-isoprenylcysteine O-methyltransferase Ste14